MRNRNSFAHPLQTVLRPMSILQALRVSTPLFIMMLAALPVRGQEWQEARPMPAPRYDMAAAVLDGQIYVIGGRNRNGDAVASVYRFEPGGGGRWSNVSPLDEERFDAVAVVLGGRIYVIGGVDDEGHVLDDVQAYLPAEDRWIEVEELEEGRWGHQAVVLDGHIYVVGGEDENGSLVTEVEVYDPDEDEWSITDQWKPLTARVAFALAAVDGEVYTIGGFGGGPARVPIPNPEVFTGGSVSFLPPPGMLRARGYFASTVAGGSVFLLGGIDERGVVPDLVQFKPSSETWQRGPQMSRSRERFAAATVDGRLYAIGGRDDEGRVLASTETMLVGTSVEPPAYLALPAVTLEQNHPNPFTHSTTVSFLVDTDRQKHLTVEVYDPLGRHVRTLVDDVVQSGRYEIVWDGREEDGRLAGSGTYFCVFQRDGLRTTTSMILIR